ncbi:sulfatase [Vibrio vulnificus]|uniref:sulfatase family protein n=1 Tax=Vibrio vulnificus TaxID=672 RepID=UPI0019D46C87|nr:sulfatase [Vibrio vulnificus]EGR7951413.1 sulfatase [Vibrio vulnificus]EJY4609433.1 sulfatase [Vibrio vulnificus]ELV8731780.1 sulfatase [Vibrio vulnificus]MBN8101655.1 sulfatase [Vibrio vulnificus]MBN8112400.1 sulfatase [Vibrio vulnificus]
MKKPNLLYVFPDQFRLMSLGIWQDPHYQSLLPGKGDPVLTPNLDHFAEQATLLSNAVSNCPVCSPHRGSLFTGQFPSKSGVPLNCHSDRVSSQLPEKARCFTDVLSDAGYYLGYIGKWHLDWPTENDPANPGQYVDSKRPAWDSYTEPNRRHGIDEWYGYGTFDQHCNPHYYDTIGQRHEPRKWSAEHETDKAIEFLTRHQQQRPDQPFALFVSMNPPHSPYSSLHDCREADWQRYCDQPLTSLLTRDNADHQMEKAHSAPFYFANVTGVDQEFGRLVDTLKTLGEWENTIVVFTSDHGETLCSHGVTDAKNSIYNESLCVPFLLKDAMQNQAQQHPAFLSSADIMPTVLGLMGLSDLCPDDIHGRNLAEVFRSPSVAVGPTCALYLKNIDSPPCADGKIRDYFAVSRGIKTERYSLALHIDAFGQLSESQFFDNQTDPYQTNNRHFDPNDPVVRRLLHAMAQELVRVDDPWAEEQVLAHLLPYDLFTQVGINKEFS